MTTRLAAFAATAMLAVGCGSVDDRPADPDAGVGTAPGSEPRRLERDGLSVVLPPGWDGFTTELGAYEHVPGLEAANVPWIRTSGNVENEATRRAFEQLPAGAIVVAASASRHVADASQVLEPPIELEDGYFLADGYEGQPAPDVSTQLVAGRLGDRYLFVQVYFGRNHPTAAMRAEADAVLATLELGPEPVPGTRPGWREHRDDQRGLVVRYPPDWHVSAERLTPFLDDPIERLHGATYPLRAGGDSCAHVPEHALEDLGPSDALISVYEWRNRAGAAARTRPEHFLPFEGSAPESRACLEPPPDNEFLYRMHTFADAGRRVIVYVAIGADADFARRIEVGEVVDALRFAERR
jgi:hypothetical protein